MIKPAIFCFFTSLSAVAQPPTIEWAQCYGGTFGEVFVFSIGFDHTIRNGIISAGVTNSNDGNVAGNHGGICGGGSCFDGWLLSLDSVGAIEWQKCLGGTNQDQLDAVQQTSDLGYIAVGSTNSIDGDVAGFHGGIGGDAWICKVDTLGNLLWQKCLGGSEADGAWSLTQNPDSNFYVGCISASNNGDVSGHPFPGYYFAWVVKLDLNGNILWQKIVPNTYNAGYVSVVSTFDGGCAVSCAGGDSGYHNGSKEFCLTKFSSNGDLIWQKFYGGNDSDAPYSLKELSDSGFVICGATNSHDGDVSYNHRDSTLTLSWNYDYWLIKLDSLGILESEKTFGGTWNDYAYNFTTCLDSGYLLTGSTNSDDGDVNGNLHGGFGAPDDCWVIKLDKDFNIQWSQCLGGTNSDIGDAILQLPDSNFIVKAVTLSSDGDINGNHGSNDYWIAKLSTSNSNIPQIENDINRIVASLNGSSLTVSFISKVKEEIDINLFDMAGRLLLKKNLNAIIGDNNFDLAIPKIQTGIYLLRIENSALKIPVSLGR